MYSYFQLSVGLPASRGKGRLGILQVVWHFDRHVDQHLDHLHLHSNRNHQHPHWYWHSQRQRRQNDAVEKSPRLSSASLWSSESDTVSRPALASRGRGKERSVRVNTDTRLRRQDQNHQHRQHKLCRNLKHQQQQHNSHLHA